MQLLSVILILIFVAMGCSDSSVNATPCQRVKELLDALKEPDADVEFDDIISGNVYALAVSFQPENESEFGCLIDYLFDETLQYPYRMNCFWAIAYCKDQPLQNAAVSQIWERASDAAVNTVAEQLFHLVVFPEPPASLESATIEQRKEWLLSEKPLTSSIVDVFICM